MKRPRSPVKFSFQAPTPFGMGRRLDHLLSVRGASHAEAFPEAARFTSASTKAQQRRSAAQIIQRFEREQASRNTTRRWGAIPAKMIKTLRIVC